MLSDCSHATMTLWKRLLTSMPCSTSTSYMPIQLHHGMIIIVTWWRLKHGGLNVHIVVTSPIEIVTPGADSLECFAPPSMRSTLNIGQMPSSQTLATRMLFGQKSTRCWRCRIRLRPHHTPRMILLAISAPKWTWFGRQLPRPVKQQSRLPVDNVTVYQCFAKRPLIKSERLSVEHQRSIVHWIQLQRH